MGALFAAERHPLGIEMIAAAVAAYGQVCGKLQQYQPGHPAGRIMVVQASFDVKFPPLSLFLVINVVYNIYNITERRD